MFSLLESQSAASILQGRLIFSSNNLSFVCATNISCNRLRPDRRVGKTAERWWTSRSESGAKRGSRSAGLFFVFIRVYWVYDTTAHFWSPTQPAKQQIFPVRGRLFCSSNTDFG